MWFDSGEMAVGASIHFLFDLHPGRSFLHFTIDFVQDCSSSGGSFVS